MIQAKRHALGRQLLRACAPGLFLFGALSASAAARPLTSTVTQLDRLPPPARSDFKMPNEPNMLFYLQRSTNTNTVVYVAKLTKAGQIDDNEPVVVFWRRYEEQGQRRALNFIERTIAYGVRSRDVEGHPGQFDVHIVSLPEISFRVESRTATGPKAILVISGKPARLIKVYLQVDDSGLIPNVVSVDIYAVEEGSGHLIRQHIVQG